MGRHAPSSSEHRVAGPGDERDGLGRRAVAGLCERVGSSGEAWSAVLAVNSCDVGEPSMEDTVLGIPLEELEMGLD